jgi:F0F1-type ATP synthase beta subunit
MIDEWGVMKKLYELVEHHHDVVSVMIDGGEDEEERLQLYSEVKSTKDEKMLSEALV